MTRRAVQTSKSIERHIIGPQRDKRGLKAKFMENELKLFSECMKSTESKNVGFLKI